MSKHVQGANGKIYLEVTNPDTLAVDYIPLDPQPQGVRIDESGNLIPIRDTAEAARQHGDNSHNEFFRKKTAAPQEERPTDPREERQQLRRNQMIQQMAEEAVLSRAKDVHGPDIHQVSDEGYQQMRLDPEFRPLSTYAHLLTTPSGKTVRPILAGEVGMIGTRIYRLEDAEKFFKGATLINVEPTNKEG